MDLNSLEPAKASLFTTKSGLRVLILASPGNIFQIEVMTKVGMYDENNSTILSQNELEFAHFLEHLNAQFTSINNPDQEKVVNMVESLGGIEWNAYTKPRVTGYYTRGTSIDPLKKEDNIWKILDIMLDSYFNFTVDEKIFYRETQAVLQELARHKSNFMTFLHNQHLKVLFSDHPSTVGIDERMNNVLKKSENIKNFKNEILEFRKKHYHPKNSVIVIGLPLLGSIEETNKKFSAFVELIKQRIPVFENQFLERNDMSFKRKQMVLFKKNSSRKGTIDNPIIVTIPTPIDLIYLLYSVNIPALDASDVMQRTAIHFISFMLADGFTSKLLKELRGKVYSIQAGPDFDAYDNNTNLFNVQTSCDSSNLIDIIAEISNAISTMYKKFDDFASPDDLKRFKEKQRYYFEQLRLCSDTRNWISYGEDVLFDETLSFTKNVGNSMLDKTMFPVTKEKEDFKIVDTIIKRYQASQNIEFEYIRKLLSNVFDPSRSRFVITHNFPEKMLVQK